MTSENPFAKFATQQPAAAPPPEKSANPFVKFTKPVDTSPYSVQELMDAYRKLPRDDPRREQVKQQIIKLGNEPFERGIMSKEQAQIAGITEGASLGLSDEINAGIAGVTGGRISALGGKTYDEELQLQRQQAANAQKDDPGRFAEGQIAGMVLQAAPTLGASIPENAAVRAATNIGGGALQNGIYEAGSSTGDMGDRAEAGGWGALTGAALGVAPSVIEGAYGLGKGLIGGTVRNVQKITNPKVAAEKELVRQMVKDWKAGAKEEARALKRGKSAPPRRFLNEQDMTAAEAAGQRTMVSDIGGDATRLKLDAAANISDEGSNELRGAAAQRQSDSGSRVTDVVNDTFGDTNPKTIADGLRKQARVENEAAYGVADANPNATHMWNPVLQRALSTSAGKKALKSAIIKSRDKALRNGEDIIEPVFVENADGLMEFSGQFRRPNGQPANIQGMGLNLRFWDSVKKSMQDDVDELMRAGRKEEAADIIGIKNEMVDNLDHTVPEYKTARGTAKEFFGKEDALEAGADYFRRMKSFDIAEARDALQKMSAPERELFARGYAGELVTRISTMGEAENVAKLFKSPQDRMRMRDALGNTVADQLEAYTHREVVQSYLGTLLGSNSLTAKRQIAAEGLRAGAGAVGGGYLSGGDPTSMGIGALVGLASRGGYRFTQRKVIERYAREMAELATSDDEAVIARILTKVSQDPGYMAFSRSVSAGISGAGRAAGRTGGPAQINIPGGGLPGGGQRVDPRMPFADGGLVPPVRLSKAGLVGKAAKAAGKLLGFAEEKAPKAVADLGRMVEDGPVMLNGKDVSQFTPGDWGEFGRLHGRNDVGPASDDEFLASLVNVPTLSGRPFTVPGGLDDVDKPFTYYDLMHLKSQSVDPNDLAPDVHRRVHNRMVRSMQPGTEFDDVDRYNQLLFGMISPNQPLTPNELAMARVRARSPEDIQKMADLTPWKLGDAVPKDQREEVKRGIIQHFGLQAKGKGGIGASGSADYTRMSEMAKMHGEKPEFYRFGGADEGGLDDAENWANFAGRVAGQTPGLGYKTASLATVWQDPVNAAISAVDRHMAASFKDAMFSTQKATNDFNRSVLKKFNKGRPRGQGAKSFDEMMAMPGGRGALVDELFVHLNRTKGAKLRSAKTGEFNQNAPEWAKNADWIREPDKVEKMSDAYVAALRENDRLARGNNQGLFANQWMLWDRIRERLEPHEIMHPAIRHLPKMSLDQVKAANKAHSKAGYKAATGKARPANPSELAYFSIGAPLAGASALGAAAYEPGQEDYQ